MKPAVIFDFDGTIVDSLPAVIKVFEDLTRRPRRFTKADLDAYRHMDLASIAIELKIPKWRIPILLFRGRRMMRHHMRSISLQLGMEALLRELHVDGYKMYILSSNSKQNVEKYLQWHHLDNCFEDVAGGASLLGKAPRLLRLLESAKLQPAVTWYVGDETRDIIAAKAVGLRPLSVTWGYNSKEALQKREPEAIVSSVRDLKRCLDNSWKK